MRDVDDSLRNYIAFSRESVFVRSTVWSLVPGITTANDRHYNQADSASKRNQTNENSIFY